MRMRKFLLHVKNGFFMIAMFLRLQADCRLHRAAETLRAMKMTEN